MVELKVRPVAAGDLPALTALVGELGYPGTIPEVTSRLAMIAGRDDQAVFVAARGLEVAGWIHVAFVHSMESESFAEIRGLVVAEQRRGAGIGSALVARAEEWARQLPCRKIRVRSNVTRSRTHDFYKRRGYSSTKTQAVFDKTLMSPL